MSEHFTEDFIIETVKQVIERDHPVSCIATRLDIPTYSLYTWIKKSGPDSSIRSDAQVEFR
ncbi:transposase [Serratia marcescens]|nr:transposase [Serratia marcescens]ELQ9442101.1 transposase [Serratia marcescens]ELT5562891.1 transposase [Serratia marcescens]